MDAAAEGITVERQVRIAASRETVWEFLVDPAKHVKWMGQMADLDPRPGGRYRVGVIPDRVAKGEYLEVDPPSRLVFSFGWEPGASRPDIRPGSTVVELDLLPDGEGTILRLTHRLNPDHSAADSHAMGWVHYLGRLAVLAGGGDPGPDPFIDSGGSA